MRINSLFVYSQLFALKQIHQWLINMGCCVIKKNCRVIPLKFLKTLESKKQEDQRYYRKKIEDLKLEKTPILNLNKKSMYLNIIKRLTDDNLFY